MDPLVEVWEFREEVVYPKIFGARKGDCVFALTAELFTQTLNQETFDPRWLFHGVIEFEPTKDRSSWLYVTSGLSNPWETDPEDYETSEFSGLGTELVLETLAQSTWAIQALGHILGYNILLAHGRFGDLPPLDYGHRIPLGGPITIDGNTLLNHVVITQPTHYAPSFDLKSGHVDFFHLIGVSEAEIVFAKQNGTAALVKQLRDKAVYPLTDPERPSIL